MIIVIFEDHMVIYAFPEVELWRENNGVSTKSLLLLEWNASRSNSNINNKAIELKIYKFTLASYSIYIFRQVVCNFFSCLQQRLRNVFIISF